MAEAAGKSWSWILWLAGAILAVFFGALVAVPVMLSSQKYGPPSPRGVPGDAGWMGGYEDPTAPVPLAPGQRRSLLGMPMTTASTSAPPGSRSSNP